MKRIHPVFLYCAFFAWTSLAWTAPARFSRTEIIPSVTDSSQVSPGSLYKRLDLESKGLSSEAFEYAMRGYRKLVAGNLLDKPGYLTICDFSQSSRNKRMYILDMENGEVEMTTYVAHGKNSGAEYASRFSNRAESLQSSLGFYITGKTYYGGHGLSLRIQGIEKGINDRAMARNIVIHGARYLGPQKLSDAYMGRSFGCPAVPEEECGQIIELLKNGTCLFIYHPGTRYVKGSKILND